MNKSLPRLCGWSGDANCGGNFTAADKDLKDQLHQEIEHKSKACSNPSYECSIPRIEGYDFCLRHILRDPRGNFRQCTYTYPNNKKCPNALPKHDLKKDPNLTTLCFEHNRQVQLQKTHSSVGKLKQIDSNEALFNGLAHHINVDDMPEDINASLELDDEIDVVSPNITPFVPFHHMHNIGDIVSTIRKRKRILDYASDSSTDEEVICMNNTARGYECNESDNESVDSHDDDLLKHACIYTRQEAIRISEAKLTKLQGLYIDQINRLHYILREKRRRYLHAIRRERDYLCSIHTQLKETQRERGLYEQLKALNSYHRRHGVEAVLHKKYKEKRSRATDGVAVVPLKSTFNKCIYTEGGVKCGERALPCCKYCRKHILEDKKQILFRACGKEKSGVVCQEPIACILDDSPCILHLSIPNKRHYLQKKYESETEEEEIHVKSEVLEKSMEDFKLSPISMLRLGNFNETPKLEIKLENLNE